jgi:hypothetical protein
MEKIDIRQHLFMTYDKFNPFLGTHCHFFYIFSRSGIVMRRILTVKLMISPDVVGLSDDTWDVQTLH